MLDRSEAGADIAGSPLPSVLAEPVVTQLLKIPGIPSSWNVVLVGIGAMLVLASLDFIGAIFAKEWTERQHPALFLAGLATFGVLFAVYTASLKVAELSVVTFGWIVFLQIGLVVIDRLRYGVMFPTGKWAAIVLMVLLQAYLILAPNGERAGGPS
jgi:hypothetical protein